MSLLPVAAILTCQRIHLGTSVRQRSHSWMTCNSRPLQHFEEVVITGEALHAGYTTTHGPKISDANQTQLSIGRPYWT